MIERPAGSVRGQGGTAVVKEDCLSRFAAIWSRAIYPVTATSMTRAEFEQHLLPLARTLRDALQYKYIAMPVTPAEVAGLFDIVYKPPAR